MTYRGEYVREIPFDRSYSKDYKWLIPLVSKITKEDPKLIEAIINHIWKYFRKWATKPHTASAVMFHELGTFEINLDYLNYKIKNLIPKVRENPKHYTPYFRTLWERRQIAIKHLLWKKTWNQRFVPKFD